MTPLTNYCIPEDMEKYLSFYGFHFNKKMYEFAVSMMEKWDTATGKMVKVTPYTPDEVKALLASYNVKIDSNDIYDAAYIATMVRADFWGSSIEDEQHLVLYVKDVLCDPDGYEGMPLHRFIADCNALGIVIFFERMI